MLLLFSPWTLCTHLIFISCRGYLLQLPRSMGLSVHRSLVLPIGTPCRIPPLFKGKETISSCYTPCSACPICVWLKLESCSTGAIHPCLCLSGMREPYSHSGYELPIFGLRGSPSVAHIRSFTTCGPGRGVWQKCRITSRLGPQDCNNRVWRSACLLRR